MILRLELAGCFGDVRRDHFLRRRLAFGVLRADVDRGMSEGAGRHFIAVAVENVQVFLRDVEDDAPHAIAHGRDEARDAAPPLSRPTRKREGVVLEISPIEECMLRSPFFQLVRVQGLTVDEIFHSPLLLANGRRECQAARERARTDHTRSTSDTRTAITPSWKRRANGPDRAS